MKKSYLILAAVAGLFASCTQNEEIVQIVSEPVEIGFQSGFINNNTRAELDLTWFKTTNNKFGVYGYKTIGTDPEQTVFSNEEVTWSGSDWTHPTARYWDKSATYEFFAFAPYGATKTFENKKFAFQSIPVIQKTTVDNADLAIATPLSNIEWDGNCTERTAGGHGVNHVEFTFNHILSKLGFKVWTSVPAAQATVVVKKIEIDFPTGTATWTQTAKAAVDGTTSFSGYTAAGAIETSGSSPVTYSIPKAKQSSTSYFQTLVYDGSANTTAAPTTSATAVAMGDEFIVVPVGTGATDHIFGVRVTYEITPTVAGAATETCIATGIIGTADPAENVYRPGQNDHNVVIININPAAIEFCVKAVTDWDPETDVPVEVK